MRSKKERQKGRYPRLITNRKKIYEMTGKRIPLTRRRKDGTEYVTEIKPHCSKCKCATKKVYEINSYYGRKAGVSRYEHVGYRCPKCKHLFPKTLVLKEVEEFEGAEE